MSLTLVGHRGARGEAPENTLPGFVIARQLGLKEVELDIRLSADEQLIVLHDRTLTRTTGKTGTSHDYTASQLSNMDASVGFAGWTQKVGVPTLQEVMDIGHPDLRYQLEVKGDSVAALKKVATRLARLIKDRGMEQQVVVTSSNGTFLTHVGKVEPTLTRGYICEHSYLQPIKRLDALGVQWLIPNYKITTPALITAARTRGVNLSVWTVNDLAIADHLVALGIDSLITDYPTRFKAHFARQL